MARARFAFLGRLVLLLAAGAANLTLPSIRAPLWTVEEMARQSRSCDFSVDEMERFEDPADGVAKICESFASSPGWRQALPSEAAVAAYRRGARLCGGDRHLVGLGCTCALASQPPKRGEHRCQEGHLLRTGATRNTVEAEVLQHSFEGALMLGVARNQPLRCGSQLVTQCLINALMDDTTIAQI